MMSDERLAELRAWAIRCASTPDMLAELLAEIDRLRLDARHRSERAAETERILHCLNSSAHPILHSVRHGYPYEAGKMELALIWCSKALKHLEGKGCEMTPRGLLESERAELFAEIERLRRIEAAAKDIDPHCGDLEYVPGYTHIGVRADYIKRLQAALAAKE